MCQKVIARGKVGSTITSNSSSQDNSSEALDDSKIITRFINMILTRFICYNYGFQNTLRHDLSLVRANKASIFEDWGVVLYLY